jgi:hypothetical protein
MLPRVAGITQARDVIARLLNVTSQAAKLEEELTTIARAAELFQSLRE